MAAIEILGLEKVYQVGFWRKRPQASAATPSPLRRGRRGLRLSGAEWRRQNNDPQTPDGPGISDCGIARILGRKSSDPEVKAQIGFLPEQPYFYDYLTARELLELLRVSFRECRRKSAQRALRRSCQRVGLTDAAERSVAEIF